MLKAEDDYNYDEKTKSVQLTDQGADKAERMFKLDNLYDLKTLILSRISIQHYVLTIHCNAM